MSIRHFDVYSHLCVRVCVCTCARARAHTCVLIEFTRLVLRLRANWVNGFVGIQECKLEEI